MPKQNLINYTFGVDSKYYNFLMMILILDGENDSINVDMMIKEKNKNKIDEKYLNYKKINEKN